MNSAFLALSNGQSLDKSRDDVGTGSSKLIGRPVANHHMATEITRTPRTTFPEFLTGNPLQNHPQQPQNTTNDVMNSTLIMHDRPRRTSSITRLADAITSRIPPANNPMIKPVTTSTLTFDGKNEKFELFEDWFNTLIKMQPGITEDMKINQFHAHLRKDALQTFHNISSLNKNKLEDILVVFRRKYVKPESTATAKHKWHKLIFDPNQQSLPDFLEELHQGAEKAFGENANQMINSLLYAKMPPHLKRSINTAYLENGTYEQIIQHLERELELNGLEGDNNPAITINTTQNTYNRPPNQTFDISNVECHYCKEKGHFIRDCIKLQRKREREQRNYHNPPNRRNFPPCDHCGYYNHPTEKCRRKPTTQPPNNDEQPTTSQTTPQPAINKTILKSPLNLN